MPELPEVETVCRGLQKSLAGQKLRGIVRRRATLRYPLPDFEKIHHPKVVKIARRAKYLLMTFNTGQVLTCHLGMSGRFVTYDQKPPAYDKHDHVIFQLADGREVAFRDPRRFGFMIMDQKMLDSLGPEPLAAAFTGAVLKRALSGSSRAIKVAILDQSVVAGVGNIYASEALFEAGIPPDRKAGKLTDQQCDRLASAIKKVLTKAIKAGGSSLRDHRQVNGELGYFQHQFQVYGRDKQPCCRCATPIIKRVVIGRSTFYCPNCQKK